MGLTVCLKIRLLKSDPLNDQTCDASSRTGPQNYPQEDRSCWGTRRPLAVILSSGRVELSSCGAINVCPLEVLFSSIGRRPKTKGQSILWIECDRSSEVLNARIDLVPTESRITATAKRFSVVRV